MNQPTIASTAIPRDILEKIRNVAGSDGLKTSLADLRAYSFDGTTNWYGQPAAVALPTTTEQVAEIMKIASAASLPVTVRGAGTNVSGGSIPIAGGLVLCTARMNKIVSIDTANFKAVVEAGVVLNDLNRELTKNNLFFPPDPQSFLAATIGGCVAENAGGPYAVKYGVFKHYLLGMTAVLANGTILNLGGNTMKNVVGYDLPLLVCGSEGTLAIVTQVTLRCISRPSTKQTVMAVFKDIKNAGRAVHEILSGGTLPAKIELMDNWVLCRIEETTPLGLPVRAEAMLLFELDGMEESVKNDTAAVIDRCRKAGAAEVREAKDAAEADKFWTARRAGFSAVYGNAATVLAEDVTVPTSRIPEFIDRINAISREHGVKIVIIGHAGDGNLHPSVLTDKNNPEHYRRAEAAIVDIFKAAMEFGGVISGEHGIGLEKKRFLKMAMQPEAIELLKQIKKVFDPAGILNPGKIWE